MDILEEEQTELDIDRQTPMLVTPGPSGLSRQAQKRQTYRQGDKTSSSSEGELFPQQKSKNISQEKSIPTCSPKKNQPKRTAYNSVVTAARRKLVLEPGQQEPLQDAGSVSEN